MSIERTQPRTDVTRLITPMPEGLADRTMTLAEAADWLALPADDVKSLRRFGLAWTNGPDGPYLDPSDVANVGFAIGTGRSVGEIAQRYVLRYATQPPSSYLTERSWHVRLEYRCACGTGQPWELAAPESAGQSVTSTMTADTVTLDTTFTTSGWQDTVLNQVIVDVFTHVLEEFDSGTVRYQWLSPRLRADPAFAHDLGIGDCVTTSLRMQDLLHAHGVSARTRTVTALAVNSIDHAWVEALDDDGRYKVIDPIFALLGARVRGESAAAKSVFSLTCCGLRTNRVLPWDLPAGRSVATHLCGSDHAPAASIVAEIGERDV